MSDEFNVGHALGGVTGAAIAGPAGGVVGHALGGALYDAFSKKPVAGTFATTLQNDLKPENVTLDAFQIYERIKNGHGLQTLLAAKDAADQLAVSFADRSIQIANARSQAAAAWQGDAAEAAVAATAPLSESFAMAQTQLAANSQALDAEATAFQHIHSQVEPVPATPPQGGVLNSINPFQTDVDAAINQYNAAAAKNVALYEAYSADTATARSQVAQTYAQPAPLSGAATATTLTSSPVGTAGAPPQVSPAADTGQPAGTNASAASGGAVSAPPSTGSASGESSGAGGASGGAATSPSAQKPPSTTVPTATTPALPSGRDTVAGNPVTGLPGPLGTSDTQRKSAFPGVGGSGGVGAFGGGPGARSTGTGGTGTGTGPGVRGGGPSVGAGPVSGQTPSGQQINRGPIGSGAGARGAAGVPGTPMAPAGRANGEEDQEHRRKYLVQPDPKELFGTDEPYVHPVIGDRR